MLQPEEQKIEDQSQPDFSVQMKADLTKMKEGLRQRGYEVRPIDPKEASQLKMPKLEEGDLRWGLFRVGDPKPLGDLIVPAASIISMEDSEFAAVLGLSRRILPETSAARPTLERLPKGNPKLDFNVTGPGGAIPVESEHPLHAAICRMYAMRKNGEDVNTTLNKDGSITFAVNGNLATVKNFESDAPKIEKFILLFAKKEY